MIYEQRTYTASPGRMADLQKRFSAVTLPVFDRLGIKTLGFLSTMVGPASNDLVYFIEWESLAERESKMSAFGKDPEWIEGRIASERDGPLTSNIASVLLQATPLFRSSTHYGERP